MAESRSLARSRFMLERASIRHMMESKVEFVGNIKLFYDRGHHQEFHSLSQEVAAPGELQQAQKFNFMAKNVEKQYKSYLGINVKLRPRNDIMAHGRCGEGKGLLGALFPHATRLQQLDQDGGWHRGLFAHRIRIQRIEIIHRYHLKDVIVGKIYSKPVRTKTKYTELSIIRHETTGSPSDVRRGKVRRLTSPAPPETKALEKWTMEETQMLVEGCHRHSVSDWKAILNNTSLRFDNRSPVDLKDCFRTYFPDAYK